MNETRTFVTHLECGWTGERVAADRLHNLSPQGYPLLVRYDLAGAAKALTKDKLKSRAAELWRYRELLPVRRAENIINLGEVMTPLIPLVKLARGGDVLVKDEGRLPTASFKARGLALAVSMAKELGVKKMAMPTNGNAGAALAAYASRAGIETVVFCPDDTPQVNMAEIAAQGARLYKVNGLINDCGKLVGAGKEAAGWFDVSTLKEPYRIEGKKTMGYELWEEFGGKLPDVIIYPTGGGVGLIGMWKAFEELEEMGLIGSERPRMIAAQAAGCAPIARAFEQHSESSEFFSNAATLASGLRVPKPLGDFLILADLYASHGEAVVATDDEMLAACRDMAALEGVFAAPEGGAGLVAIEKLVEQKKIQRDETVVLFNTGSGYKYVEAWQAALES